jgi:hypothetical protein
MDVYVDTRKILRLKEPSLCGAIAFIRDNLQEIVEGNIKEVIVAFGEDPDFHVMTELVCTFGFELLDTSDIATRLVFRFPTTVHAWENIVF